MGLLGEFQIPFDFFFNISCEFKQNSLHVTNISNLFITSLFKVCAHFCQTKTHETEESMLLLIPAFGKCIARSIEDRYVFFSFPFYLPLCGSDCSWVLLSLSFHSAFLSARTFFLFLFNAHLNSAVELFS